jgi:hypothetical protein
MNRIPTLVCMLALISASPAIAQEGNNSAGDWQFSLTPYVWLPSMSGTLKFNPPPGSAGSPTVEAGVENYLQHLEMALMLSGEARKGDLAIFTDVIYVDFSGEHGSVKSVSGPGGLVEIPLNSSTQTGVKGVVWELAASHVVSRSEAHTIELLGGVRYLGVETSVDWQFSAPISLLPQSASLTQKTDLWDAIVGFRGRVHFGDHWFVPYYLDAGTGDSELTWQAQAGLGYSFDWGDILLAYRHLSYDQSGDKLIQDAHLSGPGLGAIFRF